MSDTKTPKARVKKNILNKNVDDLVISETVFDPDKPTKKTTTKKTVETALKNKTTSKDFSKIISEIKATKSKKQVDKEVVEETKVAETVVESAPKAKRAPRTKKVEQVEMPLDTMIEEAPAVEVVEEKPKKPRAPRKPKVVEPVVSVVEEEKVEEDLKPETIEIAQFAEAIKQEKEKKQRKPRAKKEVVAEPEISTDTVEETTEDEEFKKTEEELEKAVKAIKENPIPAQKMKYESVDGFIIKPLDRVLHDSMIPYSEFVIMDRALPRVEDGLKPVQRRVLYSMLEVGVLPDRPYRKSARIVGDCMGKYHPHGDSSIYETLVRMAQPFNMGQTLVDGHGNFGSLDGDGAAAMRYTEAKLTPIALELLKDIDKDTVNWNFNFDDSCKEPETLPGRFPNLFVNGCSGIAVGLTTNIPPHNLREVVKACIAYMDNRNITLDELMKIMPGPDFPTGAYVLENSELRDVYTHGKGKIYVRAKIKIENADSGKKNIVITEIPYNVNKSYMLQKVAKYKDANPSGPMADVIDIVDESDRNGIRAVIKLKKGAKINTILQILYKYCDVQVTFGASIYAIAGGKPVQLGLKEYFEHYVNYQQKIIYNRTQYDLEDCTKKAHILEGLLIAIKNIDEVIRIIKKSKSTTDAKIQLMERFYLDDVQAQAILDMRLARITNLEVNKLITELGRLKDLIKRYEAILKSPAMQLKIVKQELQEIAKIYGRDRLTGFMGSEEYIDKDDAASAANMTTIEEEFDTVYVMYTPANTLKRISIRNFNLANKELSANPTLHEVPEILLKVDDYKTLYFFTNLGNCFTLKARDIEEAKFREKGQHITNYCKKLKLSEKVVSIIEVDDLNKHNNFLMVTSKGMFKLSKIEDYISSKQFIGAMKVKSGDEVIYATIDNPDKKMALFTQNGNGAVVAKDIPVTNRMGVGVKSLVLDKQDKIIGVSQVSNADAFAIFTSNGYSKILKYSEVGESARNRKGQALLGPKHKEHSLIRVEKLSTDYNYVMQNDDEKLTYIYSKNIPLDVRLGNGKQLLKTNKLLNVYKFIIV